MYYGFILTHSMYPIDKKLELKDCCFDNPRTSQEIKAVAQILKKENLLIKITSWIHIKRD